MTDYYLIDLTNGVSPPRFIPMVGKLPNLEPNFESEIITELPKDAVCLGSHHDKGQEEANKYFLRNEKRVLEAIGWFRRPAKIKKFAKKKQWNTLAKSIADRDSTLEFVDF